MNITNFTKIQVQVKKTTNYRISLIEQGENCNNDLLHFPKEKVG